LSSTKQLEMLENFEYILEKEIDFKDCPLLYELMSQKSKIYHVIVIGKKY